jgi:uncharacterized caspase-like protein
MRFWLAVSVLIVCLQAALPASAETRIALIIGNSDYARVNLRLANPVNDATAMQRALQQAGFETILRLNAKRLDFYRAVEEFSTKIARDPHAVGLFYYAGHGVQSDGVNYLIPVDAEIESDADLEANAFDVGRVLRGMSMAQNEMNIVILDACRDNPLPRTRRGMERGLARMQAPSGTFIAYAAGPDQSAQDGGRGGNGVFTGELVKAMGEPGVPLEQMFKRVIAGVDAQTHGKQRPWSEASLQGDFYGSSAGRADLLGIDQGQQESGRLRGLSEEISARRICGHCEQSGEACRAAAAGRASTADRIDCAGGEQAHGCTVRVHLAARPARRDT